MEQILPGVSIEVRSEALIVPGPVQLSTVGVVGTAGRGPIGDPRIIGSAAEAVEVFGDPGPYDRVNAGSELTLVRALQIAFDGGARDALAVRVENGASPAVAASFDLQANGDSCCFLEASSPGEWSNDLEINVSPATENPFINDEEHVIDGAVSLDHTPIIESARTRIEVRPASSAVSTPLRRKFSDAPAVGEVLIDTATGALTFEASQVPADGDTVIADYVVNRLDDANVNAVLVTLRAGDEEETYTAVSGIHLTDQLAGSGLARLRTAGANHGDLPDVFSSTTDFKRFAGGTNSAGPCHVNWLASGPKWL